MQTNTLMNRDGWYLKTNSILNYIIVDVHIEILVMCLEIVVLIAPQLVGSVFSLFPWKVTGWLPCWCHRGDTAIAGGVTMAFKVCVCVGGGWFGIGWIQWFQTTDSAQSQYFAAYFETLIFQIEFVSYYVCIQQLERDVQYFGPCLLQNSYVQ